MNPLSLRSPALIILIVLSLCAAVAMIAAAPTPAASPADASIKEQYMALAAARTRAELALRRDKLIPHDMDPAWRSALAATDAAHIQINDSIQRAITDESRRPEETRNNSVIEELNQRRSSIEQDWQRHVTVERAALDASYREAQSMVGQVDQLFSNLLQMDKGWKDARIDLTALGAAYDAVAKRADEIHDQAADALVGMQSAQKAWQTAARSATQPVAPSN